MIDSIVETIEREFGGVLMTERPLHAMPKDIDIWIPREKTEALHRYLLEQSFVCTMTKYKLQAEKFVKGELFFLDMAFDLNYLVALFPTFTLLPAFTKMVQTDSNLERFYKYIFSFRADEAADRFIEKNYEKYRNIFFDRRYINANIFRKGMSLHTLRKASHKKLAGILTTFTLRALAAFIVSKMILQISRLGKGQIIAVVGPDGSGKSTVIDKLKIALFAKTMYMGDWGFMLQPLYNKMHDQHIVIARLTYVFFYIENWLRYLRAWGYKMTGSTVLIDRYPGLNRHLRHNNLWLRINDVMYFFFPKADKYIFIAASPEVVHARRQELSVEEIAITQENMRLRLKKRASMEIENVDLDVCVNKALAYSVRGK